MHRDFLRRLRGYPRLASTCGPAGQPRPAATRPCRILAEIHSYRSCVLRAWAGPYGLVAMSSGWDLGRRRVHGLLPGAWWVNSEIESAFYLISQQASRQALEGPEWISGEILINANTYNTIWRRKNGTKKVCI